LAKRKGNKKSAEKKTHHLAGDGTQKTGLRPAFESGSKDRQIGKVVPKISSINRCQTIGLKPCVRGDQKVRQDMCARPTRLSICRVNFSGKIRRSRFKLFVPNTDLLQIL